MSSEKGQSSAFIIIFIVVIVFAVMMSGGGASLFSGNEASPDLATETPEPTGGNGPTGSPSATIPPVPWTLTVNIASCDKTTPTNPKSVGKMIATGDKNGYILLKIVESSGGTITNTVSAFKASSTDYDLALAKTDGYSDKKWKVELYSGGTIINNSIDGGELKVTKDMQATNCN